MARPKTMQTRKIISVPAEMAEAIDEYRFGHKFRTESEAIRRLIELGLEAAVAPECDAGPGNAAGPDDAADA
ncbi:ribbon-helix-helix domain-containing protein [Roseospira navarrensis]|uniref:CopG family transcriptional regulator n=1 Tax=Roseospira navarrensis TaxID=140058 RepID=A0A7X2D6C7_9PROT|nr:ribbon-helix-helix domain-containing protein [Roseospira navarrensis]MQX38602.1 hypothetical protein [Roseospira navarrensis]